jgi:hypothetical protein
MSMVNSSKTIVTRKAHRCWWCGELIGRGEKCVFWVWKEDGELNPTWVHPECSAAWNSLPIYNAEEVWFAEYTRGCTCVSGGCECKKSEAKK